MPGQKNAWGVHSPTAHSAFINTTLVCAWFSYVRTVYASGPCCEASEGLKLPNNDNKYELNQIFVGGCGWEVERFDRGSSSRHVEVSLGKVLNPKLLLNSVPSVCVCVCVWSLEDHTLSLLHPGVGSHQLRVQEWVFTNTSLDPLHQLSNGDGGFLSVDCQLILKALHFSPHLWNV